MSEFALPVAGMTCPACEFVIEKEVGALDVVEHAVADHRADEVLVEGGDSIRSAVVQAVESAGYKVEKQ